MRHHIEQKENACISFASDYREATRRIESTMDAPREPNRYDDFLKMVMSDTAHTLIPTEAREDPDYMRECLQAIDISRILRLRRTSESESD